MARCTRDINSDCDSDSDSVGIKLLTKILSLTYEITGIIIISTAIIPFALVA